MKVEVCVGPLTRRYLLTAGFHGRSAFILILLVFVPRGNGECCRAASVFSIEVSRVNT
jgi:hypothetical protein